MTPFLYSVAKESCKSYLLSFDISYEIALKLHQNPAIERMVSVLAFNLDAERLERELRTFHIARVIDQSFDDQGLTERLAAHFGHKITYRLG
jgi:hypothetical protein